MLGGEPGNEAKNITQNWNCIVLYNLSMQALVDLRKFDKMDSRSAAANEGCNRSMSQKTCICSTILLRSNNLPIIPTMLVK